MSDSPLNRAGKRATHAVIKSLGARLSGRRRGADWRGDKRCSPRAESWDVDDPKANVWRQIEDGSKAAGLAFVDSVLRVAMEYNLHERREAQAQRRSAGLRTRAEVDAYNDAEEARFVRERMAWEQARAAGRYHAPPRKPAYLHPPGWQGPLGQHTLRVLEALLRGHWFDFRTGRLDAALSQLMHATGFAKQTVVSALRRLRQLGLIHWVRRTVQLTEDDGDRRRVQTNNAYFFDFARLPARVRMRLNQLLENARRRRNGTRPPAAPPAAERRARTVGDPGLKAALDALAGNLGDPSLAS